jgi:hypothetical protein
VSLQYNPSHARIAQTPLVPVQPANLPNRVYRGRRVARVECSRSQPTARVHGSLPWPYAALPKTESEYEPGSIQAIYEIQIGAKGWFDASDIFIQRRPTWRASATTGIPVVDYETHKPTAGGVPWIRRILCDQPYGYVAYYPGPSAKRAALCSPKQRLWSPMNRGRGLTSG